MERLSPSSYIAFHQAMQRSFLAWTPLLCGCLVVILSMILVSTRRRWKELEFSLVLFAMLCVLDELVMTWTGNLPLNRLIYGWQFSGPPNNWEAIRTQWVQLMYLRCGLLGVGFSLLLASVLVKKTEAPISQDVAVAF